MRTRNMIQGLSVIHARVATVAVLAGEMATMDTYLWWGLIYLCIIKFSFLHSCNSQQ